MYFVGQIYKAKYSGSLQAYEADRNGILEYFDK
jgi:hypothetical protein